MSDLPAPDRFDRELRRLVRDLGFLAHEYRWAHGVAFGLQVAETAHVPAPGTSNPTRAAVLDHAALRGALREAASEMRSARSTVESQVDRLLAALDKDEHRHGPLFDPLRNPRTASRDDLSAAREAQHRRRERGEHVP